MTEQSGVPRYRLENDYTVEWPFWVSDGLAPDGEPLLPRSLDLAARAWAARFNADFDWEKGWPDRETADRHRADGEKLLAEVRQTLPDAEVTLHYWETAVAEESGPERAR